MTTSLRVAATVTADGKQASVELTGLTAKVADARIAVDAQKESAKKLSAELRTLNRDTAEGAARAGEIRDQLRSAKIAMIEQGAAATAASRQLAQLSQATGQGAVSAGQMRAASANLGQQIGDITQGLALGISPMTIFAQQGGQVAFAMSGMGGAIGKVAGFLSGPWGAAITGATIIIASLASGHDRAAEKAAKQGNADISLKDALEALDRATGISNKSTAEAIRLGELGAAAALKRASATRDAAQAELDAARTRLNLARADQREGGARGANFGSGFVTDNAEKDLAAKQVALDLAQKDLDAGRQRATASAEFGRASAAAKAATDASAKANQEYEKTETAVLKALQARSITEAEATARLIAAENARDAAVSAARDATKAATTAQREHNKELRDAAADAAKATAAMVAFYSVADKGRIEIANRDANFKGSDIITAAEKQPVRPDDLLARSVDEAQRLREGMNDIGKVAGKAFTASTLADAAVIGQAIGGGLGRAFTGLSALGFGTKDKDGRTGDFTGVGAKLTKLIDPLAETFRNGGRTLAANIGNAAGGAATGSVVSGIADAVGVKLNKTGSSIGGAVGSFIPIPGGEIIGSILGGIAGNLLSVKQGSTTVSSNAGKISQSSSGDATITKATGAIGNTITDAIQSIAERLGATVGDFAVSIGKRNDSFRIDRSGTGKIRGSTVTGTKDEAEALSLAIADALKDGAIRTSPAVQSALLKYADNVNKAVSEALKVKGLEDFLSDRNNPFLSVFRSLETQLKQRLDVARQYGFDLVEIEKINGEDRAKVLKDTLASATGSVRALLTDLTIGSGATGSPTQRLAGLSVERDRLSALARGGDTSQLDGLASIVKQIDDLQRETFGSTGGFAAGRADSISLLNDLIRQTEDRAKAAADEARAAASGTVAKLTEANASLDDLVIGQAETNRQLAALAATVSGGGGGTGFNPAAFAR